MRVLLISPVPGIDPPNGDVTYTEELVRTPPPGVVYETYADALASGRLREHRRGRDLDLRRAVASGRTLVNAAENGLRRRALLFREPFRYFSVADDAYDLVHVHVFSVRMESNLPLVVSNAAPIEDLYADAVGWSSARVRAGRLADRALALAHGVTHSTYALGSADLVVPFTEHLRSWYRGHGTLGGTGTTVVPNFVADPGLPRPASESPRRVGFVAKDFVAKGGPLVLEAFRCLRDRRPDVELVVAGPDTAPVPLPRGCTFLGRVDRAHLLGDLLPSLDVLAYPTRFDGLPFIALEALSRGVPLATSRYGAMPELVRDGSGRAVADANPRTLAEALEDLLRPEVNARSRHSAYALFRREYEASVVVGKLGVAYVTTLAAQDSPFPPDRDSERAA